MVSKLIQHDDWVQNLEWKDGQGKQSPDGNVMRFPVSQVLEPYNTARAPVGNIVVSNLVLKLGQGRKGSLFCDCALCR